MIQEGGKYLLFSKHFRSLLLLEMMNIKKPIVKAVVLISTILFGVIAFTQPAAQNKPNIQQTKKMKVEIWSDVMCPFCYIGKRKFESALAQFEHRDQVEVVWKSFQLQPDMKTDPSKSTIEHLAESKGWTLAYTRQITANVTQMAKEVGLTYDFDKAVVANSFDAHRLSHYAKSKGKGDAMEEQLFKAYFCDGKNTADHTTLTQLATAIGLNESEVKQVLATNAYADEVRRDIYESQQIGVTGVPFFVFNNKYAVSGAQQPEVFLNTLRKAWSETAKADTLTGAVCKPDGSCD